LNLIALLVAEMSSSQVSPEKSRKQLTDFEKGQIIAWRDSGETYRKIAERLGRSSQTIADFVKKHEATNDVSRLSGSGRKRKTDDRVDRRILREQKKDWGVTAGEIKGNLGLEISESTVRNRLLNRPSKTFKLSIKTFKL
jgi:IS30 family transposase